jgi:6-phosphogluconolactonase
MRTLLILGAAVVVMTPIIFAFAAGTAGPAETGEYLVYLGTYTRGNSKGIYVARFDSETGVLSAPELVAEMQNASFLTIAPNGRFLYAVGENTKGTVKAFAITPGSGKLTALNEQTSGGNGPCYVALDKAGKYAMVANYGSGSVEALPIKADGSLGEPTGFVQHTGSGANPRRQNEPHAHSINPSPDNLFVIAADLGLDKLFVYKLDPVKGTLTPNDPPAATVNPGAGPRHFAFHPNGKNAYVINEIQSTVTAFTYDAAAGVLKDIQTISTLPAVENPKNSTAEIQIHPSGKFLYGSNRGQDTIAVFAIKPDGKLEAVDQTPTQGKNPRNFTVDPTGKWLFAANQNTANVVVFRIDQATGKLTPTGQTIQLDWPVCVKFLAVK